MILLHPRVFLWLDDTRPAPSEWKWVKTVAEAISLAEAEDVEAMSLDHDLDDASSAGASEHEPTGLAFVQWMVESGRWPKQKPLVHSANPFGRERMVALIDRHWPSVRLKRLERVAELARSFRAESGHLPGWSSPGVVRDLGEALDALEASRG